VSVNYEEKRATVRFEPGTVRLEQILKRYVGTRFTVSPAGPITSIARLEGATVRAWIEPWNAPPATVFIEFDAPAGNRFDSKPTVMLARERLPAGLKPAGDSREVEQSNVDSAGMTSKRRFAISLSRVGVLDAADADVSFDFELQLRDDANNEKRLKGTGQAWLSGGDSSRAVAATGVSLIGGTLELKLGHLCDQRGCVEHLHKSLQPIAGLAGVRPHPSVNDPCATIFVRGRTAIDVVAIREKLRDRGVAVRGIVVREFGPSRVRVELSRTKTDDTAAPSQCLECLASAALAMRAAPWAKNAAAVEAGFECRVLDEIDLGPLLGSLDELGVSPPAVWLVPDGVTVPPAATPIAVNQTAEPKLGGADSHPLVHFCFRHECSTVRGFMNRLGEQTWASRTGWSPGSLGVIPATRVSSGGRPTAVAAIGDRQTADLLPLLHDLSAAGSRLRQIRLAGFGDVRIQLEFAHLCGEVEYSKPPEKKPAKKDEAKKSDEADQTKSDEMKSGETKKDESPKKEEKPFVPQPLRPAPSSNARQAIERAVAKIAWVEKATYLDYHTKPEFNGPTKFFLSFMSADDDVVRIDELLRVLGDAGFPPTAVRVSRLFPGIMFGQSLPADVELRTRDSENKLLASFRRPGRPLAVAFVSLHCTKWDKYKYEADAKYFAKLKQTIDAYRDRVDFVAVSANADDEFAKVAELLERAGLELPLLHDSAGQARAVLNAQVTPPPHLFIFDLDGLLRYAGDPHSNWNKPDEEQKEFLGPALDTVLAGKFAANRAVSFKSSKCNCSSPNCKCPKCGCGPSCRCDIGH